MVPAFSLQDTEAFQRDIGHSPAEGIENLVCDELDVGAARLVGEVSRR
jgi:hypothetical protein